jgi:multiple sugar transport system substrate-binding protein
MADSPLKPPVPPTPLQPVKPLTPVTSTPQQVKPPVPQAPVVPPAQPATPTPSPTPAPALVATQTAPVPPVVPKPVTPPAAVAPVSQAQPQFSSRILQGASAISAQPFQDPSQKTAPTPPPAMPGMPSTPATSVPSQGMGSAVPQEATALKGTGVPPNKPPAVASRPNAIFESLKNPKLIIAGVIVLLVVALGVIAMNFLGGGGGATPTSSPSARSTPNVNLTYWGLWEPTEVMQAMISDYETNNPGVKITYVQQKSDEYRARLQSSLRDGSGPDLFRYHNTWMPMVKSDLAPAGRAFTTDELEQNYYPIMSRELIQGGQVVGTPLMFDGLALLYNESMLAAANATPPRDWEQIRVLASQLAVKNGTTLERGGIALGTASNVDNFSDILGLMMLQNSANPGNPVTQKEQEALTFYTLFTRTDGVWNETLPTSTVAFANEKVAMIIVPSWRIFEIQQMNPNLKFGVTRVPQLGGEEITWGSYWVEGVSKASKNSAEAWKFLAWMSQPDQLRKFHSGAAAVRGFGELYPRVEMAADLKSNPLISAYLDDALFAQSWYMASMTHDDGLNDKMIQYYTDAVNEMNARGNVEQTFTTILPGVQQVLSTYGVTADTPASLSTP